MTQRSGRTEIRGDETVARQLREYVFEMYGGAAAGLNPDNTLEPVLVEKRSQRRMAEFGFPQNSKQ